MTERTWLLLRDRWTYLRILYLVLAFPLAITYFVLIVTGISVGLGLTVIGVGLAILVLTMLGWLLAARLERELAIHLLGANIRPISVPERHPGGVWPWLRRTLGEPVTWKSLAYLLIELPFGIFSFTLTVVLLTVSLTLALYPLAYLAAIAFPALRSHINVDVGLGLTGLDLGPGSHPFGAPFLVALLVGMAGIALFIASLAALNGAGWLWARFAEQMLGVDESHLQLAAAKAEADSERGRAERADHSRREMIVNASHELRTPVASISAHVESLLKPDRQMDAETRQYLTVVGNETERLSSLVDDLLILARADADELHLDVRPTDVREVVDRVCAALAPLARRERNVSLAHASAPEVPRAMADPDRLAQVLGNLVRNAVNNTPDGGLISVDTQLDGDRVMISVADTGIGIDPEDLSRVFDRFYRTDESRARDSGGSGLGLAIVRDLITAMGATITADSTPGHGSVFRIRLQHAAT
jgi:two-component system, OmpR family, phosphate regulon sensor histidine kinase PhoR